MNNIINDKINLYMKIDKMKMIRWELISWLDEKWKMIKCEMSDEISIIVM